MNNQPTIVQIYRFEEHSKGNFYVQKDFFRKNKIKNKKKKKLPKTLYKCKRIKPKDTNYHEYSPVTTNEAVKNKNEMRTEKEKEEEARERGK